MAPARPILLCLALAALGPALGTKSAPRWSLRSRFRSSASKFIERRIEERVERRMFDYEAKDKRSLIGLLEHLKQLDFLADGAVSDDLIEIVLKSLDTPNVLRDFDATEDLLLNLVVGPDSGVIDQQALTSKNISDPAVDYSDRFENAFAWPHLLFPGVVTNGYDPTLVDGDVMFAAKNEVMNALFETPLLSNVVRYVFDVQEGALPVTPRDQGQWKPIPSLLNTNAYHPNDDDLGKRYDAVRQLRGLRQNIGLRELYRWPESVLKGDFDDESFAKFFFAGVGQGFLAAVDGHPDARVGERADGAAYVAALDHAASFDVRPGAGVYGGDTFFNADGTVSHIYYNGERYDPAGTLAGAGARAAWEGAKRRVRGSVIAITTLVDHLLGVHLHYSNSLAWAVPRLPPKHPLRRFLWAHVFNANGVNRKAAATLSIPGGLFARGWQLSGKGVTQAYEHAKANNPLFRWMTVPERFALQKIPAEMRLPLHEDGLPFYHAVEAYVGEFVDLHYADDAAVAADARPGGDVHRFWEALNEHQLNQDLPALDSKKALVDVIAAHLFYVTGYHTHVGSVHHEAARTGVVPSLWFEGDSLAGESGPPNAELWKDVTFARTASLRLPITGDTASTEQRRGFARKTGYQNPLPPDAVTQEEIRAVGYPELFANERERAANRRFVEAILDLQTDIIARNQERFDGGGGRVPAVCRPYNAFDANYVEMGVAI